MKRPLLSSENRMDKIMVSERIMKIPENCVIIATGEAYDIQERKQVRLGIW